MALRLYPTGATMTPADFAQSAIDKPLSPWATFTGAAADAALQSPGLGTAIRETYAPELAKEPVAGGRGGVAWRYQTPGEVEAKGDRLYQSPDDYKASPYYRDEIPYEKGLTESRAKALSEMYDTSRVRQFYSSKRPVVAFTGSVVGSAVDPINYIPIVGEAAYAAAAARTGRIASRAFLGGIDAAANTALFATITADQRARFGDDVSWAAIGMNSAYAALAGVAIGGTFGALTKGPKLDAQKIDAPRIDAAPVQQNVQETPLRVDGGSPPELRMGDAVTARFDPVRPVTVADVVSRMETAQNRIKAAEVLNDAVDGLVTRGEVALGTRSQGTIDGMDFSPKVSPIVERMTYDGGDTINAYHGSPNAIDGEFKPSASGRFGPGVYASFQRGVAEKYGDVKDVEISGRLWDATKWLPEGARDLFLSRLTPEEAAKVADWWKPEKMLKGEDAWEILSRRLGPERAQDVLKKQGYDGISGIGDGHEYLVFDPQNIWLKGKKPNKKIGETVKSYAHPPQETPPATLKQAEAKVAANSKPDADPEQAALDRSIADAKEEGFDPETGEHDLEPEIDSLRNQELLTAEEEQALAAADETYQSVDAWQKVMDVARSCYLK